MNKVFRIVWSEARQAWLAVSELTKIKGKSKTERQAQGSKSAVIFSSKLHFSYQIILLGLFTVALPAEVAFPVADGTQGSGSIDKNTAAIMGEASFGSISNGSDNGKITLSPDEKKIDIGGARITNVGTPSQESDVANKKYVDDVNNALDNKGIIFETNLNDTKPIKLGERLKIVGFSKNKITTTTARNGTIEIHVKTVGIDINDDDMVILDEEWTRVGQHWKFSRCQRTS